MKKNALRGSVLFIAVAGVVFLQCRYSLAQTGPREDVLSRIDRKLDVLSISVKNIDAGTLEAKMDAILENQSRLREEIRQLKERISSRI